MVTTENFPKLISDTKPDNQEAHRTPTKINAGKTSNNNNNNNNKTYTYVYHVQTEGNQRWIKILKKARGSGENILPIEEKR